MGYLLLGIESLATSLLLVALVLACVARLRRRWMREALWMPVAVVPLLAYLAVTIFAGLILWTSFLESTRFVWWPVGRWFYPMLVLTVCYAIGAGWLRLRAWRLVSDDPAVPAGASWPRAKLAVALAVAVALHLTTFWNLDLAVRQQLATWRGESGALALSAAPPRVLDRDNAALDYLQAFEAMGLDDPSWPTPWQEQWDRWTEFEKGAIEADDVDLNAFLRQQEPALDLLRRAAGKPGCYFDRDYGRPSIEMLLPEMGHLRNAARLLAVDARYQAALGNTQAALKDVDAMFAIAEHAAGDSLLISMLVAAAIDEMAAETLSVVLGSGTPSEEDLALLHLDGTVSYRRALERSMRMEEAFGMSVFCDVATGRVSVSDLAGDTSGSGTTAWQDCLVPLYRIFLMSDDAAVHRRFIRKYRQLATQPYYEARQEWEQFGEEVGSGPGGLLTRMLLPALSNCAEAAARAEARRAAVRLAVAACRYRAAHDQLPERLHELAPELIAFVPRDPFDGKPMKLKRTARGAVIYSVGPDIKDDGGAVFDSEKRTGDITFELSDRSE